jgi:multicomponent K+:H+ antiporter subunit E
MRRWFPFPLFSAALAAMWLMLNGTLEAAQVVLGALLGWGGGLVFSTLQKPLGRMRRRAVTVAALFWLVFADIVRSNVAVARIALNPRIHGRAAGFLTMPLEVRHPGALAVLALIITATPGTSWARYDAEKNALTIHVLDLIDEQAWIEQFKERYERRLMEIFQ